jgi:hypothetical protein
MNKTIKRFRSHFKHLEKYGLIVHDKILNIEDTSFINVSYPFIFDRRWLPSNFEEFFIKGGVNELDLPIEFQIDKTEWDWYNKEYIWAPERFEKFVNNNINEIRVKLDNPNMTKLEMLDALCNGNFEAHKKMVEEKIRLGELPEYKE